MEFGTEGHAKPCLALGSIAITVVVAYPRRRAA